MHEAQQHQATAFLTLTYANSTTGGVASSQSLTATPPSPLASEPERTDYLSYHTDRLTAEPESLSIRHLQLFLKRLRDRVSGDGGSPIKYFACGEYGEKLGRPHYHIALFGHDYTKDRYIWRKSGTNYLYRSAELESTWPYGHSEIGTLSIDSAMYIASYVTKKVTGNMADWHYRKTDEAGNDYWIEPEFAIMSRGGRRGRGLGYTWFMKHHQDVINEDHVVIHNERNGTYVQARPPRYYDKLLEQLDPVKMTQTKFNREIRGKLKADDNTPARLEDKETVTKAKMKMKKRQLETK